VESRGWGTEIKRGDWELKREPEGSFWRLQWANKTYPYPWRGLRPSRRNRDQAKLFNEDLSTNEHLVIYSTLFLVLSAYFHIEVQSRLAA
jgi:hypothetical protein